MWRAALDELIALQALEEREFQGAVPDLSTTYSRILTFNKSRPCQDTLSASPPTDWSLHSRSGDKVDRDIVIFHLVPPSCLVRNYICPVQGREYRDWVAVWEESGTSLV